MRKLFLVFVLWVSAYPAMAQIEVKAAPSETVELMSVMMSLTGVSAFSPPHVLTEYKTFVDSWFTGHQEHSAIKFIMNRIMNDEGIDMVAPAAIGVNSDIVDGRFVYPGNLYGWSDDTKKEFVEEVNKFYSDTKFCVFWERVRDNLYPKVVSAFNDTIIPKLNINWLNRFVPVEGSPRYGLTISLPNGAFNFGVSKGGIPNPVVGVWDVDMLLNPTQETFETYLPLTIHEYLHFFCNPLIDKCYADMEAAGSVIYPKISEQASRAHYGSWRIVLYESFVRAAEMVFMRSDDLFSRSIEKAIESDKDLGFYWTVELSSLLSEYEANRNSYPTLESFMPRVVAFYRDLAAKSEN